MLFEQVSEAIQQHCSLSATRKRNADTTTSSDAAETGNLLRLIVAH